MTVYLKICQKIEQKIRAHPPNPLHPRSMRLFRRPIQGYGYRVLHFASGRNPMLWYIAPLGLRVMIIFQKNIVHLKNDKYPKPQRGDIT